jgi:hypothetical protein
MNKVVTKNEIVFGIFGLDLAIEREFYFPVPREIFTLECISRGKKINLQGLRIRPTRWIHHIILSHFSPLL